MSKTIHRPLDEPGLRRKPLLISEDRPATDWQAVIWREWRHTEDKEIAGRLFELVADEPVGTPATAGNALFGLVFGGLIGWLISLIGVLANLHLGFQWSWPMMGAFAGGGGGLLLRFLLDRPLTWRTWLARLTFNLSPIELGMIGSVALAGLIGWFTGWLSGRGHEVGILVLSLGLLVGGGARLMHWLLGTGPGPDATYFFQFRGAWFWWAKRPHRNELVKALRQATTGPKTSQDWTAALAKLKEQDDQPISPEALIDRLQSKDWTTRFLAAQRLVRAGGDAVPQLSVIAADNGSLLRRKAIELLQRIEQETTARLAHKVANLRCPRCLARLGVRSISISDAVELTLYGCRVCGQNREFWPKPLVAVLDSAMVGEIEQPDAVRVSWLTRRTLFDFDRVEIVRATDEQVERFAVQVGNDTDPIRRHHYKRMTCLIEPKCPLSDNTLRILERTFGKVERDDLKNREGTKPA